MKEERGRPRNPSRCETFPFRQVMAPSVTVCRLQRYHTQSLMSILFFGNLPMAVSTLGGDLTAVGGALAAVMLGPFSKGPSICSYYRGRFSIAFKNDRNMKSAQP